MRRAVKSEVGLFAQIVVFLNQTKHCIEICCIYDPNPSVYNWKFGLKLATIVEIYNFS